MRDFRPREQIPSSLRPMNWSGSWGECLLMTPTSTLRLIDGSWDILGYLGMGGHSFTSPDVTMFEPKMVQRFNGSTWVLWNLPPRESPSRAELSTYSSRLLEDHPPFLEHRWEMQLLLQSTSRPGLKPPSVFVCFVWSYIHNTCIYIYIHNMRIYIYMYIYMHIYIHIFRLEYTAHLEAHGILAAPRCPPPASSSVWMWQRWHRRCVGSFL